MEPEVQVTVLEPTTHLAAPARSMAELVNPALNVKGNVTTPDASATLEIASSTVHTISEYDNKFWPRLSRHVANVVDPATNSTLDDVDVNLYT